MPEVHAIASMGAAGRMGGRAIARDLEQAMTDAVLTAMAEGVSLLDTEEMRRRQRLARLRVLWLHDWISADEYQQQRAELERQV